MMIIDKILQSFKPRATKPSPAPAAPRSQKAITIEYQDITINRQNIDMFRSGQQTIRCGGHFFGTNVITLYRYKIDPGLNLSTNDPIRRSIEEINKKGETVVIAHETKHVENGKYGNPLVIVDNFYESSVLYGLDEVSAYATEHIKTNTPTFDDVCMAVSYGIDDFWARKNVYIPKHVSLIQQKMAICGGACKTQAELQQYMNNNIKPNYSEKFYAIACKYLTFAGQSLRTPGKPIPNYLNQKLKILRCEYEKEVAQAMLIMYKKLTQDIK